MDFRILMLLLAATGWAVGAEQCLFCALNSEGLAVSFDLSLLPNITVSLGDARNTVSLPMWVLDMALFEYLITTGVACWAFP